ncbi:MAG: hypothetical protein VX599_04300 [Pseudomonadota bacterium]|jgi:ABC-type protease/lipase transport system fused ATPase/permease subunit|nr:hypothetical protein [Pseudomonadota bacterium]
MKPMISSLSALGAIILLAAPMATAQSCSQKATQLQERQVEAQALADARLELVDEVEAAGDAWEDVEVHRLASAGHAETADQAKAVYEGLKAELLQKELSLQSMVIALNEDVATYNEACAKDQS